MKNNYVKNGLIAIAAIGIIISSAFLITDDAHADEQDDSYLPVIISEDLSTTQDDDVDLSQYIEYEATVDSIYIADDGTRDKIYITDTDKHVLVFAVNPELLLLHSGDSILVYVDEEYEYDDVIYVNYYKQFGFVVY